MPDKRLSVAVVALAITFVAAADAQEQKPLTFDTIKPAAQVHWDAAKKLAGDDYGPGMIGVCGAALPKNMRVKLSLSERNRTPEPVKVFDNLYYLGIGSVTSWAITTSEGIIMIDSLDNPGEAKTYIEGGLRKLGLDPANIKYIVVTHGHGDHYGGAQYLADTFHAHVMLSAADWQWSKRYNPVLTDGPPPKEDMVITDGQKLTLGGETVSLYITPGHTPGTVSVIFPVTDRGQPHVAALFGGTAFQEIHDLRGFQIYDASITRFLQLAEAAKADVPISNHPFFDLSFPKIDRLKARGPNDPNPFVTGQDDVKRALTIYQECAKTFEAQMTD